MKPNQLYERRGELQIVDVREPQEWRAGRIQQARHMPMDDVHQRLGEIDPGKPLAVVCRTGDRSGKIAQFLSERGFRAENVEGGMKAWKAAGLPMVGDEGAPRVA